MARQFGLQSRAFRSVLSMFVAVLMVGSISYLGVQTYKQSQAATGATMYVSPDTASVATGSTLSVSIRENSGTEAVNSVQSSLTYDPNNLQFVSITEGGAFPMAAATNTSTPGVIRVGRANTNADQMGDKPIVTVNFKVIGTSGSPKVNIDKSYSFIARASDSKDILQNIGSGTYAIPASSTSSAQPILFINPASGSVQPGSTINAAVHVNAYSTSVTTVEAAVSYPTNLLQYVGVAEGGVFTTQQRTNAANGVVDIIRAVSGGSGGRTGDNPVVTIKFKVIGNSGTATLGMAGASAAYDQSGTGRNVLNLGGSAGAAYTISSSAGATPPAASPPPVSGGNGSTPKPTTITSPSQALTVGASGDTGRIALTKAAAGSALTELGGEVSLSPIIDPAWFSANPDESITKVEYYVDGTLISTQKSSPFTYKFDTGTMRNGEYTMAIKTYFSGGTVDTRTEKLLVKNQVNLSYVARHYLVSVLSSMALLVALAVIMMKLVIPRYQASHQLQPVTVDRDALYGFPSGAGRSDSLFADDPTVIAPLGPDGESAGPSSAAMTTQALPMSEAPQPATIQPATAAAPITAAAAITTTAPIIRPEMTGLSEAPVQTEASPLPSPLQPAPLPPTAQPQRSAPTSPVPSAPSASASPLVSPVPASLGATASSIPRPAQQPVAAPPARLLDQVVRQAAPAVSDISPRSITVNFGSDGFRPRPQPVVIPATAPAPQQPQPLQPSQALQQPQIAPAPRPDYGQPAAAPPQQSPGQPQL